MERLVDHDLLDWIALMGCMANEILLRSRLAS